jgi:hypothetical protein
MIPKMIIEIIITPTTPPITPPYRALDSCVSVNVYTNIIINVNKPT